MNGDDYGYDLEFVVWCLAVALAVGCAITAYEIFIDWKGRDR